MSIKTLSTRRPGLGLTSVFNEFFEPWNEWLVSGTSSRQLTMPNVNIVESKDNYRMEVAAPGLHKKDFTINVDGNVLTISGQKEENKEENKDEYSRQEYNYSSFSRSFTLPEDIRANHIEATYDGGILKLTLPRNVDMADKKTTTVTVK
jgi:HSP20 family protein